MDLATRVTNFTARSTAAVTIALLLAACASLATFEPPRISVASVGFDRLDGPDAYFTVQVVLANPNPRELEVDALEATLSVEGEPVTRAALTAPVKLPATADTTATLSARAGMDAVLRAAANAMRRGAGAGAGGIPPLRYAVQGSATIGGRRFEFARSGEFGAPGIRR